MNESTDRRRVYPVGQLALLIKATLEGEIGKAQRFAARVRQDDERPDAGALELGTG